MTNSKEFLVKMMKGIENDVKDGAFDPNHSVPLLRREPKTTEDYAEHLADRLALGGYEITHNPDKIQGEELKELFIARAMQKQNDSL